MILSSGAKYNQINFFKNHVSGNARKIGVTVIWWFTIDIYADIENDVFLSSKMSSYLLCDRPIICETGVNSPSRHVFLVYHLSFDVPMIQINKKCENRDRDSIIIFIKSWNEWGEGYYLEPDLRFGRGFIEATRQTLDSIV